MSSNVIKTSAQIVTQLLSGIYCGGETYAPIVGMEPKPSREEATYSLPSRRHRQRAALSVSADG